MTPHKIKMPPLPAFLDRRKAKIEPKPVKYVCSHCGSEDVKSDAYAAWSVEDQCWEVAATFDKGAVCEDCGGETRLEEVPADWNVAICRTCGEAWDEGRGDGYDGECPACADKDRREGGSEP